MSCKRNNSNNLVSGAVSKGTRGSLFNFVTICPEVVERHQIYAGNGAAPQNQITTATGILCACPRSVVRFGGGNRLGRLLGDGTKKRPPCPLITAALHANEALCLCHPFPCFSFNRWAILSRSALSLIKPSASP
jgi:hypothetical protein